MKTNLTSDYIINELKRNNKEGFLTPKIEQAIRETFDTTYNYEIGDKVYQQDQSGKPVITEHIDYYNGVVVKAQDSMVLEFEEGEMTINTTLFNSIAHTVVRQEQMSRQLEVDEQIRSNAYDRGYLDGVSMGKLIAREMEMFGKSFEQICDELKLPRLCKCGAIVRELKHCPLCGEEIK